ncbi:magnesium-translocating P-type ATPase [Streptomyces sp. BPTC-684]|uniref:magnesium-translocating P-type ATPase n=1 Tax=Streptomyces sp. BPTC-684 TaxID=3043734 RepID=UPI0024B0F70E|nr:magnesium-translocating P-type ATPase [Streptomyces sp. BPTC-684]WHM40128.1 magnesium-translocating P-type ATPase [Streptomyces sp. BPTC-684]
MTMLTPEKIAPPGRGLPGRRERKAAELEARTRAAGERLVSISARPASLVLKDLDADRAGLGQAEVLDRQERFGPNVVAHEKTPNWLVQLARAYANPFIGVLVFLAAVMYWQDPADPGVLILSVMVGVSGLLRFWQEYRSGRSADALKKLVTTTTAVQRRAGRSALPTAVEVPMDQVVPGDLVKLAAGDLIPADLRILSAKDLMVSQAALSGESLPVAKADTRTDDQGQAATSDPVDADNLCLMGTSVTSGTATGVVVATGADTYFGSMAGSLAGERPQTNFDTGVRKVSFLLIRFMLVMVPVVFAINGFTKGDWDEAFLFAVAVAVGLTPEMLPMVVSANLARGAVAMSRRKVVVKRLNAIQNLGAMDVLCTDKTGTLTEDRIVLDRYLDVHGDDDNEVLEYGYLNAHFQTGLKNLMDQAVVDRVDEAEEVVVDARFSMVDEIPFDFARRRMSVVLSRNTFLDPDSLIGENARPEHVMVTKGAVEEVLALCTHMRNHGEQVELTDALRARVTRTAEENNRRGLRVLAVATRTISEPRAAYGVADESGLTLIGYLAFLDPPKADAAAALRGLADKGIAVKVVTGDNELVAARVCAEVGLDVGEVVPGSSIDLLDDAQLREVAARATVFAKVNPVQKARIVRALQADGHTVGFLGDGINDAAALRDADVGISVDTAVDIAKESADIILLEKDLTVLEQGVVQGRTTFGNTIKYIKMTASSNFGNVFSVLVASAFIPFQPMLAIHLLIQNLVYDIAQLATPWDRMDEEYLRKPRNWDAKGIGRFMVTIGPISSVFDVTTFLVMWNVFGADSEAHQALFQSGWFVEGLLSQTLIVHMIRTRRIPFVQSRASRPVMVMTLLAVATGLFLPFSPLAASLGFTALPMAYFPYLFGTLLAYCALTQLVKTWYIRKFHTWL